MNEQTQMYPPWQQTMKEYRESTLVLFAHRNADGRFVLGKACAFDPEECFGQVQALLVEYERQTPGRSAIRLANFERTLAASDFSGDIVVLSGHKVGGKHILINTMLCNPRDMFERSHELLLRTEAPGRWEQTWVDESDVDPREALLTRRAA